MKSALLAFATALSLTASAPPIPQRAAAVWPEMRPFEAVKEIDLQSSTTDVIFLLPSANKQPTYALICHAGDERTDEALDLVSTGGLLCTLQIHQSGKLPNPASNRSLLLSDHSSPIFSRGNFNPEDVVGPCAAYPEYGAVRRFRMRGFNLTIALRPLQIDSGYHGGSGFRASYDNSDRRRFPIGRAELRVTLVPDAAAVNAKPAWPDYQNPKGVPASCAAPMPNREQPFCRNDQGSAMACPSDWFQQRWPWE